MPSIDEKRVYGAAAGATRALVASTVGVVSVGVSDDIVGEFGIDGGCVARDLAVSGDVLAVATDDDVLVGDYESTDHGPATTVAVADTVTAVAPDGTVSRLADDGWEPLGTVASPTVADGPFVGGEDGVVRVDDDGLSPVGLADVRDLAATPVPYAATDDGLYRLGNGWRRVREGSFRAVTATEETVAAATAEGVVTRGGPWGDDWREHRESSVVALAAFDDSLFGLTGDGRLRVTVGDGWRGRTLGVPEPAAVAVTGRAVHPE